MAETKSGSTSNHSGSSRIRTREHWKSTPGIDKVSAATDKTKAALVRTRQNTQSVLDDNYNNEISYASDRAVEGSSQAAHDTVDFVRRRNQNAKDRVKSRLEKEMEKRLDAKQNADQSRTVERGRIRTREQLSSRNIKTRDAAHQGTESIKTTAKSSGKATAKGVEKTVKTAESTSKVAVKTTKTAARATKEGAQAAAKASEKAAVAAKNAAAAAERAAAAAARSFAAAMKAISASLGKLTTAAVAAIAGAVPFIALGCVILAVAVLCTGDTAVRSTGNDTTTVIAAINDLWQEQLDEITEGFEDKTMEGGRATWPQIFSIYTAMSSETSVDNWEQGLDINRIFWDMNWIHYDIYAVAEAKTAAEVDKKILMRSVDATFIFSDKGSVFRMEEETYQNKQKLEELAKEYPDRKLHSSITVTVKHKSVEEMMEKLGFSQYQMEQAQALMEKEFASFWQERIYGVVGANDDIVNVAITQLGNSGGWPYWEYCGWPSRVEWCACFITWCGGQCGYVKEDLLPMTSSPWVQMDFFKQRNQWVAAGTEPSPGMIVFYDYYGNGMPDHVGIIENVENGEVHSIEGNWGDSVQRVTRVLGDPEVMGYGWIVEK